MRIGNCEESQGENVIVKVLDIAKKCQHSITLADIDNTHRVGPKKR